MITISTLILHYFVVININLINPLLGPKMILLNTDETKRI